MSSFRQKDRQTEEEEKSRQKKECRDHYIFAVNDCACLMFTSPLYMKLITDISSENFTP